VITNETVVGIPPLFGIVTVPVPSAFTVYVPAVCPLWPTCTVVACGFPSTWTIVELLVKFPAPSNVTTPVAQMVHPQHPTLGSA